MIQRALATLLCLMGAAAIALGIASATAWRADDVLVADAQAAPGTTMIVTDPGVLDLAAGTVTVTASADARVVIALGRAQDVDAWVGGDAHTRVTGLLEWHVLATEEVEAEPEPTDGATADPDAAATPAPTATETPAAPAEGEPAEGTDPATTTGEDAAAPEEAGPPDPAGSDLWLDEVSGTGDVEFEWTAQDGRWSVLVASVGADAGPPSVSLAWPQVVTTPWLWPGVVVGSLLVIGGLAWWTLLLLAGRRARRRVPAPAVAPVPEPVGASAADAAVPAAPLTRRQLRELEEQQRSRGGRAPRAGLTERLPVVVPGPRRDAAPAAPTEPSAGPTSDDVPADRPAGRRARRAAEATSAAQHSATPAPAAQAPATPPPTTPPPATPAPTTPAPEPGAARDRRFGLRSRRRADDADAPAPAPAAPVEPPVVAPVVPAATQWTPAASADAWRRAWGLPAAGAPTAQPDETAQPAQPTPPAQPDQPGESPLRRRRDNR